MKLGLLVGVVAAWLSPLCLATDIQSWEEWKTMYNARVAGLTTAALIKVDNVNIQGATDPATPAEVSKLWKWYHAVPADYQSKAKTLMGNAWTGAGGVDTSAINDFVIALNTRYTAAGATYADKLPVYNDMVSLTTPAAANLPLQTQYRALSGTDKESALAAMTAPLVELFRAKVLSAGDATTTPTYRTLLQLLSSCLNGQTTGATDAQPMYAQGDSKLQGEMKKLLGNMLTARLPV